MAYVVESAQLLKDHSPHYVVTWKIRNVESFGRLIRGEAKRQDVDNLLAARNITEAMMVVAGIKEDDGTLARSACALIEICDRLAAGKKALYPAEMQALRDMMQVHDELLDLVTMKQFEDALAYARREIRIGNVQMVKELPK